MDVALRVGPLAHGRGHRRPSRRSTAGRPLAHAAHVHDDRHRPDADARHPGGVDAQVLVQPRPRRRPRPARSRRAAGPPRGTPSRPRGAAPGSMRTRPARRAATADSIGPAKNSAAGHRPRHATTPPPTPRQPYRRRRAGASTAPAARRPGRRARGCPRPCPGCGSPGGRPAAAPGRAADAPRHRRVHLGCRASAPTRDARRRLPHDGDELASRLMSTRCAGAASRMLSIGIRLCPPASTLPCAPTAASVVQGLPEVAGAVVLERRRLHPASLPSDAASAGPPRRSRAAGATRRPPRWCRARCPPA